MREFVSFLVGAFLGATAIAAVVSPGKPAAPVDLGAIQAMLDAQTQQQADQRFREYVKDQLRTKRRMTPIVSAIEEQFGSFGADWHREFGE